MEWQYFYLQFEYFCTVVLALLFLVTKSGLLELLLPCICNTSFFSSCFQNFFIFANFQQLDYMHIGMVFFEFIVLKILWVFLICNVFLSKILWHFHPLFLQIYFLSFSLLRVSSETPEICLFDLVPWVFEAMFTFLLYAFLIQSFLPTYL